MTIVACSGHRPPKIGGYVLPNPTYNSICLQTENILKELQPEYCITGMCIGYDFWFANVCNFLNIPYLAAIPFEGQENLWSNKDKIIYKKLLAKAKDVVMVSTGSYAPNKMQIRNEYLVDNSDILLACFNGQQNGGTYNCINYAKSKNKQITYIDLK